MIGSSSAQRSVAYSQRVLKRHPEGGSIGDGISPSSTIVISSLAVGSGKGLDPNNSSVYGWAGFSYSSFDSETSQSFPRYITATRSEIFLTTARS